MAAITTLTIGIWLLWAVGYLAWQFASNAFEASDELCPVEVTSDEEFGR